jgi:hypothetical protein
VKTCGNINVASVGTTSTAIEPHSKRAMAYRFLAWFFALFIETRFGKRGEELFTAAVGYASESPSHYLHSIKKIPKLLGSSEVVYAARRVARS